MITSHIEPQLKNTCFVDLFLCWHFRILLKFQKPPNWNDQLDPAILSNIEEHQRKSILRSNPNLNNFLVTSCFFLWKGTLVGSLVASIQNTIERTWASWSLLIHFLFDSVCSVLDKFGLRTHLANYFILHIWSIWKKVWRTDLLILSCKISR